MHPSSLLAVSLLATSASAFDWTLQPLVLEGDALAGGNNVTGISNMAITNGLDWLVEVTSNGTLGSLPTLLGPAGQVAQDGDPLTAPVGATIRSFDAITLNESGDYVGNLFLDGTASSSDDSGVFRNFDLLVQEGAVAGAPEFSAGTTYRGFFETKLGNDGQILLLASVDDPAISSTVDQALIKLFVDGAGALAAESVLMKEGDTIPGGTGLVTTFGTGPHNFDMNDSGVWMSFVDTDLATSEDGHIVFNGFVIAQEGQASPIAGRNWSSLSSPELSINNSLEFVYSGSLDGDSTTNLVIIKNGAKFMQEGDAVPGLPAFTFTSFGSGPIDIADSGDVLWYGDWNDTDTDVDTGLFLNEELIVQEGVTMIGGQVVDTLRGVQDGYFISDDGDFVVFEAILADGTEGAFLASRSPSIVSIDGCSSDGTLLSHVGGAPSIGGSVDLNYFSPSMLPGVRFLGLSSATLLDGSGCGILLDATTEALIDFSAPGFRLFPQGTYTGTAETLTFPVPSDIALVGANVFTQALFVYPTDPVNVFDLTNALDVTIGL